MIHGFAEHVEAKLLILNGDVAMIAEEGVTFDKGMELHRIDGNWKVTHLTSVHAEAGGFKEMIQTFAAVARTVDRDVKDGKAKTAKEAMGLLDSYGKPAQELMKRPISRDAANAPAAAAVKWAAPSAEAMGKYWGKLPLSREITELIASLPNTPRVYMTRELMLLIDEEAGLSLSFKPQIGLNRIDLFAERTDGYRQYSGALPNGLDFSDTRLAVEKKLGRPVSSGGGSGGTGYFAAYPRPGIMISYAKESARDPENRISRLSLRAPDESAEAPAAKAAGNRVAFRLVIEDPSVTAEELADPGDASGNAKLRIARDVLLDGASIDKVYPTTTGGDSP